MAQGLGSADGYAQMQAMLNRPTAAETTAKGFVDATADIPQNTFAGGLVKGLAQGNAMVVGNREGKKRDRMTEYLMAQQQYEMDRARQADEMTQQLATLKAGYEAKELIQSNIDLSLDAYQSTGDLSMLNETLTNEAATPFRKLFENQVTEQGGVYQGVTATPEGDLMPFGVRPDGTRVYGQAIPVQQGYSQGYLTAKQAKDLDMKKARADLAATEALANQRNATAASKGGVTMQTVTDVDGNEVQVPVQTSAAPAKPMPATAVKMQNEAMEDLSIANNTQADLDKLIGQIDKGDLNLGPLQNPINRGLNWTGNSTTYSRNLSSFEASLEKLRNDSLRLNKGVQTDGDAQRAWNELLSNINDKDVVRQRLQEIKGINQRASDLKRVQIETMRNNFGQAPMDFGQLDGKAAIGQGADLQNLKSKYGLE